MSEQRKPRILFVGSSNSHRTQMAECLLRHYANNRLEVKSAGLSSGSVDRNIIEVMNEIGVPTSGLQTKLASADFLTWADLIVIIRGNNEQVKPAIPNSAHSKTWIIEDPVEMTQDITGLNSYRAVRDLIKRKTDQLIQSLNLQNR